MSFKDSETRPSYPDSDAPLFGINDMNYNKLQERRKRAQKLFHDQLSMASEKNNYENMRSVKLRREEEHMLKKTRLE